MSDFSIDQKSGSHPGIVIVRLNGPVTLSALPSLQPVLRALTAELTIVDLEHVPYMDSAGLGALLNLLSAQQKQNRKVAVAAPSKRVSMLFDLTKVNTVLPIFATVAEAEAA